jgi:hypothetical protein
MLRAKGRVSLDATMRKLMLPARIEATADSPRATARLSCGAEQVARREAGEGRATLHRARRNVRVRRARPGPCFTMTVSDQRTFALGFERRS